MRGNLEVAQRFRGPIREIDPLLIPRRANDPERFFKARMALVLSRYRQAEIAKLLGRAPAAEPEGRSLAHQEIGDGHLLGDVERVMEVQADDRRAQADPLGHSCKMEGEEQWRRQMPMMRVSVVLRKPGVRHTQAI